MNEQCGYCQGRGWILGKMYDCEGRQAHTEPPRVTCEYCDGAGECERGGILLAATPPKREE